MRLRPARASDAEGIRGLFHSMPVDDVFTRFFRRVRTLSNQEVQRLCNLHAASFCDAARAEIRQLAASEHPELRALLP